MFRCRGTRTCVEALAQGRRLLHARGGPVLPQPFLTEFNLRVHPGTPLRAIGSTLTTGSRARLSN